MLTLNKLIISSDYTENELSFVINTFILNERIFWFLRYTQNLLSTYQLGEITIIDNYSSEISLKDNFDTTKVGNDCRLSIKKHSKYSIFFSEDGFKKRLRKITNLESSYFLIFSFSVFSTKGSSFVGRQGIMFGAELNKKFVETQLRSTNVVSLNNDAIQFIPKYASEWITTESDYPKYWSDIATPKLLTIASSEILIADNKMDVTFRGDRRVILSFDLKDYEWNSTIFKAINNICKWIYDEGKDIETRHQIFNNQMSILSTFEIDHFKEDANRIFIRALENSNLAYRYHLLNSNKELTKNLTEINKTLFEHINKIRQNTIDLVNNLWKDFATAFGLLVLNFSLKKPEVKWQFWNYLLFGLIAYLIVSYYLSSSIGFWYYKRLQQSLLNTKDRIYGYLTDKDFNDLAIQPLKNAQYKFIYTFWIVLLCYLSIVVFILFSIDANTEKLIQTIYQLF